MKIILDNILYGGAPGIPGHSTNEGDQLSAGLAMCGWKRTGFGYDDGCVDVPTLLERHKPDTVLVQAREDFDATSAGCFDKRVSFKNISALAAHPDIYVIQVVKDCPGKHDRREAWCNEIKPDALLTYYHNDAVVPLSPWMAKYTKIRHRHTIDADVVKTLTFARARKRCIVSGAMNRDVYPLRTAVMNNSLKLGVTVFPHCGYGLISNRSNEYLRTLSQYKVSVACASRYSFALRKQLESIAAGCMVVTDLLPYDGWPWLDRALVRVSSLDPSRIQSAIDYAESSWTPELAEELRTLAMENYDYKICGIQLADVIGRAASQCSTQTPS